MHKQELMDKVRASKAMRILLSFALTFSCASGLLSAMQTQAYADDTEYQDITFDISGEGSVTLTSYTIDDEEIDSVVVDGDETVTLTLPINTYVHMTFDTDEEEINVSIVDENGNDAESSYTYTADEFRDVTVTEVNKTVEVTFGEVSSFKIVTLDLTSTGQDISVGDVYSGSCEVTSVSVRSSGGVNYARMGNFTGFLSTRSSATVYCADHGAAAPYAGQEFYYTYTVTSINTETGKVKGTLYCTAKSGSATDESLTWESGKGYQRLQNSVTVTKDFITTGYLTINKSSSNTSITSGNDCYSLAGAVFTVYDEDGDRVGRLTTNSSGTTSSLELDAGTYTVKETTAPTGYALNSTTWTVTIESDETTTLNVTDTPQNDPAGILLQKVDSDLGSTAQGTATLEGAEYVVEYYDGYYDTAEDARASGSATRTWVFATDEDGFIYVDDGYLISSTSDGAITSDSLYYDSSGDATIPLGTVVIYEYTAPEGYVLSDEIYVTQVTSEGNAESVFTYNAPTEETALAEQVIRGGVEIYKNDIESDLGTPLGGASLDGTQFEIVSLNDGDVVVDGITYSKGDVVATLTIEDGYASTSDDFLPYGTYSIQEVSVGEGYLLTDDTVYEFTIDEDGEIINPVTGDGHVHNQVKRGDVSFNKKATGTSDRLAGVAFKITSTTTGESHVVVTDENGYINTSSSWNSHSSNTNANDWALDVSGTIDSSELDAYAGVWFGLTTEGDTVDVDDTLGALPYDTYLIEELRCTANEGYTLVSTTLTVSRDGVTIDFGTIDDPSEGEIAISTYAYNPTDRTSSIGVGTVSVADKVSYSGLTAGEEYKLITTVVDSDTGETLTDSEGNAFTSTTTFTASATSGYVTTSLEIETYELAGKSVTIYEELYRVTNGANTLIAEHKDKDDVDQMLDVVEPAIGTNATDSLDGDKLIAVDDEVTIIDTVSYANLTPGEEYTVYGTVMVKSTGEALTDASGNAITSSVTFTPESASGTVEVTFTFDTTSLEGGTELVVFETLELDGYVIATHEDLEDAAQTVTVEEPSITTVAKDAHDGDDYIVSGSTTTIIDTVSYANLVPGKEYSITGNLMLRSYDEEGNAVEVELEAGTGVTSYEVYSEESGTWITYTSVDTSSDLYYTFSVDDEGTLTVYKVERSDSAIATLSAAAQQIDATYESGMWREVELTETITSTVTFTPESSSGEVELSFTFDSTSLDEGSAVVVFESLYLNGVEVATHADIEDEDQTVYVVVPDVTTTATDGLDGDKTVIADKETTVTDAIAYSDLLSGQEYTLAGILMDADTGLPILTDDADYTEDDLNAFMEALSSALGLTKDEEGNITLPASIDEDALDSVLNEYAELMDYLVIQTITFTPDDYSGSVSMDFSFDSNDVIDRLSGETKNIVVFEVLFVGTFDEEAEEDPIVVALEADVDNEDQTVVLTPSSIGTTATDASDGDHELLPSSDAVITDLVEYTGLIPGQEYILRATLYDKATGEPLTINDKTVTAELRFTPNSEAGSVSIDLELDASELEGYDLVVFEELYKQSSVDGDTEEVLVAEHKDIDDENQTVTVTSSPEGTTASTYGKTGGDNTLILSVILALLALSAMCGYYYIRRRNALTDAAIASAVEGIEATEVTNSDTAQDVPGKDSDD